jgi:hypothetical protein
MLFETIRPASFSTKTGLQVEIRRTHLFNFDLNRIRHESLRHSRHAIGDRH